MITIVINMKSMISIMILDNNILIIPLRLLPGTLYFLECLGLNPRHLHKVWWLPSSIILKHFKPFMFLGFNKNFANKIHNLMNLLLKIATRVM